MPPAEVVAQLETAPEGLSAVEASRRLALVGPNSLRARGANLLVTLARQFRNPLLLLLAFAATLSIAFGQQTDAAIILAIVALSVGLGAFNEYRSERAIEDLHSRVSHTAIVIRDGVAAQRPVATLVPGDIVALDTGAMVPADVRLLQANELECDEAVLTGESLPADKSADALPAAPQGLELPSCAFMGTLVRAARGGESSCEPAHPPCSARSPARLAGGRR